jgi:hypothetical protein
MKKIQWYQSRDIDKGQDRDTRSTFCLTAANHAANHLQCSLCAPCSALVQPQLSIASNAWPVFLTHRPMPFIGKSQNNFLPLKPLIEIG